MTVMPNATSSLAHTGRQRHGSRSSLPFLPCALALLLLWLLIGVPVAGAQGRPAQNPDRLLHNALLQHHITRFMTGSTHALHLPAAPRRLCFLAHAGHPGNAAGAALVSAPAAAAGPRAPPR